MRLGAEGERSTIGPDFQDVLEEARWGGCSACTRLYEALAPPVAGYLKAEGADEPDDLVSEVFLRVFAECQSFSGNEAQFRSWVFTIAHSRLVDARRLKDREPQVGALDDEGLEGATPRAAAAEDEVMDRLAVEEVRELLAALTVDQSDVLALRLIGQMSVEEVATALEKQPEAVKALQRRALAALRRVLGSRGAVL